MPKLTWIKIQNFRSCRDTSLPLTDLTPLVGCNNGGKSNIMPTPRCTPLGLRAGRDPWV